jgi:hypothetical protein
MQTPLYRSEMLSPFGPLTLLASAKGLAGVLFRPPPKSDRVGRVESKKFAPRQRIWRACVLDQG